MHPHVLAQLREEIMSTVGKDRAPSLGTLGLSSGHNLRLIYILA